MTGSDQPDDFEPLSDDEHSILSAQFRSSTLGTLPDVIGVENLESLNILLELTIGALLHAKLMRDAGEGRAAAIQALRATWMFFAAFSTMLRENLYAPLQDVLDGIRALDKGLVVPLLKPTPNPSGGRAESTGYRRLFIALVPVIVSLIRSTGMSRTDAHRLVSDELNKLGVRPGRGSGPVSARTVRGWCENAAADVGGVTIEGFLANSMIEGFASKPSPFRLNAGVSAH